MPNKPPFINIWKNNDYLHNAHKIIERERISMSDDSERPFNQLPKDEEVKRMNELIPRYSEAREITRLVPTKSDEELAKELKEKVAAAYDPFLELLNKYDKHGFNVQASVGKNAFGKYVIMQLQVLKVY